MDERILGLRFALIDNGTGIHFLKYETNKILYKFLKNWRNDRCMLLNC